MKTSLAALVRGEIALAEVVGGACEEPVETSCAVEEACKEDDACAVDEACVDAINGACAEDDA